MIDGIRDQYELLLNVSFVGKNGTAARGRREFALHVLNVYECNSGCSLLKRFSLTFESEQGC
jgi:hypothetical protein